MAFLVSWQILPRDVLAHKQMVSNNFVSGRGLCCHLACNCGPAVHLGVAPWNMKHTFHYNTLDLDYHVPQCVLSTKSLLIKWAFLPLLVKLMEGWYASHIRIWFGPEQIRLRVHLNEAGAAAERMSGVTRHRWLKTTGIVGVGETAPAVQWAKGPASHTQCGEITTFCHGNNVEQNYAR